MNFLIAIQNCLNYAAFDREYVSQLADIEKNIDTLPLEERNLVNSL